jgi:hypothetical protein
MTCHLILDKDDTPVTTVDGKPSLSGSLTSSLHRLKDTNSKGNVCITKNWWNWLMVQVLLQMAAFLFLEISQSK